MTPAIITFLIITIPLGYAYYLDYKKNKKYFLESLKNFSGLLKYGLVVAMTIILYKLLIPLNIENDDELNEIRIKSGLELLDQKKFKKLVDEQYKTEWWSKNNNSTYFKKVIEYNLLGPKTETDYFKIPTIEGGFIYKIYSFSTNKIVYFSEKPEGSLSITKTKEIDKEKFIQYLKNGN